MSNIITVSDFSAGRFKIPLNSYNSNTADLQYYIDKYNRFYLMKLFGNDLYTAFEADLVAGVPQAAPYTTIFAPLVVEDGCQCISDGMKAMITAFVYFHFVRDKATILTTDGPVQPAGENSIKLEISAHDITTRYNEGVDFYRCIQRYISLTRDLFPVYKGVELNYTLFI